jgi:uncharacterized membrane protein (DUF373 family)
MEPTAEPVEAGERPAQRVEAGERPTTGAEASTRRGAGGRERESPWQARLAAWLEGCHLWLRLAQDAVLVAIAIVLLLMGVYVLVTGIGDLIGSVSVTVNEGGDTTLHLYQGHAVVEVAENALLALILAELVGTLLLSLGGRALTAQPFLVIAVVAAVRHLLLETVKNTESPATQMTQLLGLGSLILLLVIALVLLLWVQRREPARRT